MRLASFVTVLFLGTSALAQNAEPVNVSEVLACASTEHPEHCVGVASNRCQGLHEDGFDGGTTLGITLCIRAEAEAWNTLLEDAEALLSERYSAEDHADSNTVVERGSALSVASAMWHKFREAECARVFAIYQRGTIRSVASAACDLRMTALRAIELRSELEKGPK